MARPEITGKKLGSSKKSDNEIAPTPRLAMSIPEFCAAHGIPEGMFYKLKKQNKSLTPREMRIGTRTLITFEAAADWRKEREAAGGTPKVVKPVPSTPPAVTQSARPALAPPKTKPVRRRTSKLDENVNA